jgi:hypothetical protein
MRLRAVETARDAERARAESATALFLAVARLHAAEGREDVFAALDEIAFNCLDRAQISVYLREGAPARLEPVHAGGPRARAAAEPVPLGVGLAGRAATVGRLLVVPAVEGGCDVAIALGHEGGGALVLHGLPLESGALPEELAQRISIVAHHTGIALLREP